MNNVEKTPLDIGAIRQLFLAARSQNHWLDKPVGDEQLRDLYEVVKWGPTSMNCSPMRLVFVRSPEARERLLPAISPGNHEKVRSAPVVAIVGYDMCFFEKLPQLFPHRPDAGKIFQDNENLAQTTSFRNGSLQGGYLILAARALGLDCGPLSGFDHELVNQRFFNDAAIRVNFLCCLGYGDPDALFPRSPRLDFNAACEIQ
ncbi:malonic semialdehyde reductase [Paraburkholderia sp. HD33-4]|uniref:malonic semialdehyde reductase n=1 Tax=Paraburkholderia sp. HD33-4 TaxID=2883242 RepID=UPI001F1F30C6|nr:malonic semialdehyde reductase [Paraburkholderia sp. HD33-4]